MLKANTCTYNRFYFDKGHENSSFIQKHWAQGRITLNRSSNPSLLKIADNVCVNIHPTEIWTRISTLDLNTVHHVL